MSRNKDKEKAEICKARKDSGLSCNGCAFREDCNEIKAAAAESEPEVTTETSTVELPDGMRPGTKQAKIYGLLKKGQTAKEIVATKEFAPESVYIVARKYFPDAISPNNKNVARVKKETAEKDRKREDAAVKAVMEFLEESEKKMEERNKREDEQMQKALHIVKEAYKKEQPKVDERIIRLEQMVKDGEKCEVIATVLKDAKEALEDGKIIETYKKLQQMIEYLEVEK